MHTLTLMSTVVLLSPIFFCISCLYFAVYYTQSTFKDTILATNAVYTCVRFHGIWSIATTHSESIHTVYLLTTHYSKYFSFQSGCSSRTVTPTGSSLYCAIHKIQKLPLLHVYRFYIYNM